MRGLPLATLGTFKVVAKHQSLTKAAAELGLTDSAISHQIRKLEEALGCKLFERYGRGVSLTDAGRLFATTVGSALHDINHMAWKLKEVERIEGRLTIASSPMFSSRWLSKNLGSFLQEHPFIEYNILLVDNDRVIDANDADIGIQFGHGGWDGKWSAHLAKVQISPACSPEIIQHFDPSLDNIKNLKDVFLLHRDDGSEWRRWLAASGDHDFSQYRRNIYCSDLSLAIDLALEGAGFVLVSDTLTASDIKAGNLIRPFLTNLDAAGNWYALCDPEKLGRPINRAFLKWLLERFGRELIAN
jgi:LysR family glycine cleavage system transcriptional activator